MVCQFTTLLFSTSSLQKITVNWQIMGKGPCSSIEVGKMIARFWRRNCRSLQKHPRLQFFGTECITNRTFFDPLCKINCKNIYFFIFLKKLHEITIYEYNFNWWNASFPLFRLCLYLQSTVWFTSMNPKYFVRMK